MSAPWLQRLWWLVGLVCGSVAELSFLPLPSFGAEVRGLDLTDLVRRRLGGSEAERATAQEDIDRLHWALHRERLLAFRQLGTLAWEDQLALTSFFGEAFNESRHGNRKPHPAIPDPRVAVFSNDPARGVQGAGTEGWHVDGNVVDVPHAITFIHSISAIPEGDTSFVPLREVVVDLRARGLLKGKCTERAPPCLADGPRAEARVPPVPPLDDVYFQSGIQAEVRHPLIYAHPVTGFDTMVFGLGALSGRYHRGCLQPSLPASVELSQEETDSVTEAIRESIDRTGRMLRWRWASGDLVMVDNLAVAHHATEGTQGSFEQVGLRLMQRTTVKGTSQPQKRPILHTLPHECILDGAAAGGGADHYCVFSLAGITRYEPGAFDSREHARHRCRRALSPSADLAMAKTAARNQAMEAVVSAVGLPHWLGGNDQPNGVVTWLDGSGAAASWAEELPWHELSGQPNDCDGPGSETCLFMGPGGRWFDFACQPKVANTSAGITAGPEIAWGSKPKQVYDIHVLCGMHLDGREVSQLGLRSSF